MTEHWSKFNGVATWSSVLAYSWRPRVWAWAQSYWSRKASSGCHRSNSNMTCMCTFWIAPPHFYEASCETNDDPVNWMKHMSLVLHEFTTGFVLPSENAPPISPTIRTCFLNQVFAVVLRNEDWLNLFGHCLCRFSSRTGQQKQFSCLGAGVPNRSSS